MIYYTADQHFGHSNIIRFCGRPFVTVAEMDEALIKNWNNTVFNDDIVYILGDLVFHSDKHASYYMDRLKGVKHLFSAIMIINGLRTAICKSMLHLFLTT